MQGEPSARPETKGHPVTFSFETGEPGKQSTLRCTV